MAEITPMMRQFFDLKAKHPDAILLFRCGDFYETYADDAVEAAGILGITLTKRNNGKENESTAMAGFPHHALDTYLPKLVRAGRRVAICDQLEDPKLAKKLVKRGITELVTPGVAMTDTVLTYKENNFLAAVHFAKEDHVGVSFLDISTGDWFVAEGTGEYVAKLMGNFDPKEVLFERGRKGLFEGCFGTKHVTFEMDDWVFTLQTATDRLTRHFGVRNLKGFGIDRLKQGIVAAGAILQYVELTGHTRLGHITHISRIEEERFVRLDPFTVRNLELLHPMNPDGRSLLDIIDRTVTPMGARLLGRWMLFPLRDVAEIGHRLDVVEHFFRHPDFRDLVGDQLHLVGDLERITSKVNTLRATPRDLVALAAALRALQPVREACLTSGDETLHSFGEGLDPCVEIRDHIARSIQPDPPLQVQKGNVIASGVSAELDDLRRLAYSGKDYLTQLQQREAELTGISSLKIGFNNVFGYYLEVRNTFRDRVPDTWIRKQTLTQAERYITPELKEYEEKILGAEEKIQVLEAQLFADIVSQTARFTAQFQKNATLVAQLDCLLSFALAAAEHRYLRPVVDESTALDIRGGRHPVIECQLPPGEPYVANDVSLDTQSQQILIITGPNMAGKSALLRQTALITLMAQMGSFVPAESATIGVVDKIFTRVGASDNISMGESTFMVEMSEAANILNNLSERSLVLFDELGRGTSTYDGISIAWAIVEYIHENPNHHPRTLFATHYHELNEMAKRFTRIRNFNVSVREVRGKVIFLRKLEPGGSEHSFGIHVARLAGMPDTIVRRADTILHQLEADASREGLGAGPSVASLPSTEQLQLNLFQLDDPVLSQIRDEILNLDINALTPIDALNKLDSIKRIIKGK